MAFECGIAEPTDVFNPGIMFANWHVIQQFKYLDEIASNLELMTHLKEDKDSMYPWKIRRSFGYDNETLFAHRIGMTETPYETLPIIWNTIDLSRDSLDKAHLVHVISKQFECIKDFV